MARSTRPPAAPPPAPEPVGTRGFPVLMHLHLDGRSFAPGDLAFVTEGVFAQLQRDQVFSPGLDWEDGAELQSPPPPDEELAE